MGKYVKEISLLGILTALYVALCIASAPLSFAALQFRIAEVLIVLPFYNKKYSISIILGTFIANLIGPFGIMDAVTGSAATALVCMVIILVKRKAVIAPAAGIINGVIVGAMIYILDPEPPAAVIIMGSVAFCVFTVVLMGVLIFSGIEKTSPKIIEAVKAMDNPKNTSQKV